MRTYTWDYDTNTVTEWCRMGGCNHCGACCEVEITINTAGTFKDMDARHGGSGVDEEGQWHQWDNGKPHYWKVVKFDHKKLDSCYDECVIGCVGRKTPICTAWPLHPDHVNEFNDCSYRFVKLNEWEIEENNGV